MSFASYEFLFGYLPFAIALVLTAEAINRERLLLPALILVSAVFYGLGSIPHLLLLLTIIAVTWTCGFVFVRAQAAFPRRMALWIGIGINLASLTVWKYGNSLVELWNGLGLIEVAPPGIIMPLGISFYAFQQIAYLLDIRRGRAKPMAPIDYLAFVLFFPQLIAGPIVTQRRMGREFTKATVGQDIDTRLRLAILGMGWFSMGLFKKVVLADGLGRMTQPIIGQAAFGDITAWEALQVTLTAPPRVYFDFCGYSDMAVGLALLFGIRIPANFNAPFRAKTMRQFWTRWHITFHQFVRDHLYGPLVRATQGWRYGASFSLMLAIVLSSLWHGNSVQFLLWGFLLWATVILSGRSLSLLPAFVRKVISIGILFALVAVMNILFTTPDIRTAGRVMQALVDLEGYISVIPAETGLALVLLVLSLIYLRQEISTQVLLEAGPDHRDRSVFGYRPPVFSGNLPWIAFIIILLLVSFRYIGVSPPFIYFGI